MQIPLADGKAEIDAHREQPQKKQSVRQMSAAVTQRPEKSVPQTQTQTQEDPPEKASCGNFRGHFPTSRRSQPPPRGSS